MREDIQAFGKHWYDDGNLGGRAFFGGENKTSYLSIENLKTTDQGAYRCRVDFKKAPSQIYKLYLEVVGKIFSRGSKTTVATIITMSPCDVHSVSFELLLHSFKCHPRQLNKTTEFCISQRSSVLQS